MHSPIFHVTQYTAFAFQLFVPKCMGGDGAPVFSLLRDEVLEGLPSWGTVLCRCVTLKVSGLV